jgi:hypothetical protein
MGAQRPDIGDDRPPFGFDQVRPADLPVGMTPGQLAAGFGIIAAIILLVVRSRRRAGRGTNAGDRGVT